MAGEQKLFLKKLAESWAHEFPMLKPTRLKPSASEVPGSTYVCDEYAASRSVYYFFQIDFSPKLRGELSLSIHISDNPDRRNVEIPRAADPAPTSLGIWAIWKFMGEKRFSWALVDTDGELDRSIVEAGGKPIFAQLPGRTRFVWKPKTYSKSAEQIIAEAIAHLNETIRNHVLPKLEISVPNP